MIPSPSLLPALSSRELHAEPLTHIEPLLTWIQVKTITGMLWLWQIAIRESGRLH
jgi:hypothetical protein